MDLKGKQNMMQNTQFEISLFKTQIYIVYHSSKLWVLKISLFNIQIYIVYHSSKLWVIKRKIAISLNLRTTVDDRKIGINNPDDALYFHSGIVFYSE